jgi:taurine---2-oxoglutarate transaminase
VRNANYCSIIEPAANSSGRRFPVTSERDSVLHSWCVQTQWQAPTIVGGRGAHFWDADGHDYLDMSSLAECSNLGHQHPAVVKAIREQAGRLCFVTSAWGAEPRAELAEALLEKAAFRRGRVFFTVAGADANEHAVKFARQARGLVHGWVITRDRSYHGTSYACMALSGDARTRHQVDPKRFAIARVAPPYAYRCPFGSSSEIECGRRAVAAVADEIDRKGAESVAAVLMEPNAGTNGIVAPENYWPGLREVTRSRGVFLIADVRMATIR